LWEDVTARCSTCNVSTTAIVSDGTLPFATNLESRMTLVPIRRRWFIAAALLLATCAPVSDSPFRLHAEGLDPSTAQLVREDLYAARATIEGFFGAYPDTVDVHVFPRRDGFTNALRVAWGIPETACWMVGAADDRHLYILSPGVWKDEACEHDPSDTGHVERLITHEAVHVYHGQVNPSEDIGLLEEIGWFAEGLATFVSGQLDIEHTGRAAEALANDAGPTDLTTAWSGPYRYGVCGSLVAYVDSRWGRVVLEQVMRAIDQDGIMQILDTDGESFLAQWRDWVRSN